LWGYFVPNSQTTPYQHAVLDTTSVLFEEKTPWMFTIVSCFLQQIPLLSGQWQPQNKLA
jgi:hypothetical protein